MTKGITNRQLFFIVVLTVAWFRIISIPQLAAKVAGRSGWILILPFALLFAVISIMIAKLNNMYPGKTLFEYGQEILGKALTYVFCIVYAVYFFSLSVYLTSSLSLFVRSNFLPKTSPPIAIAVAILTFGYIANKGITNIGRLFEFIGVLYLITTSFICFQMLTQGMPENILPLYSPSEAKQLLGKATMYCSAFGGLEILFLIPFTQKNNKAPRVTFFSILTIGVILVLVTEGSMKMLGINNTLTYTDALVEAMKITDTPVIERLDVFYLTFGLGSACASLSMIYYSTAELICRMLPKANRRLIIIIVGVLIYAAIIFSLEMPIIAETAETVLPIVVLFSGIAFPTLLFIVAKIKNRKAGMTA